MNNFGLTVVITTYNRPELVRRAADSAIQLRSSGYPVEIIVVDDASAVDLPAFETPDIICHTMAVNGGPGPARMAGLARASQPWVLMLDDDDILKPDAIETLRHCLPEPTEQRYPVYQFSCEGNPFAVDQPLTLNDYLTDRVSGEFTPVFHRQAALQSGLTYLDSRVGGEHILWWEIAEQYGLPVFSTALVLVTANATQRLTDYTTQVKKAADHYHLAELTLSRFGDRLQRDFPAVYRRVSLARITYSLLSQPSSQSRSLLSRLPVSLPVKLAFWGGSWLPKSVIRRLFLLYRQSSGG